MSGASRSPLGGESEDKMDCKDCRYWSEERKECSTNNSMQLKICDILYAAELFLKNELEISEEELIKRMYKDLEYYVKLHITEDFES